MALNFRNPDSPAFRYFILAWNVMVGLGTTFCTDIPSPLQPRFTGKLDICNSTSNSSSSSIFTPDCFHFTEDEYNALYASYAWANGIFTVFGGVISDQLGCHNAILIFCTTHVAGSLLFAFGSTRLLSTAAMQIVVMNIGRVLLGIANGSIQTNQAQINTLWFHAHGLSFAFGIKVLAARIGSILNFFLTENIAEWLGLSWTLMFGAGMSIFSLCCAIIVSRLHVYGLREMGVVDDLQLAAKRVRFGDIRTFSWSFHVLVWMLSLFYCGVFAYISDSTEFLHQRYGISVSTASYTTSVIYALALFMPLIASSVDRWGQRGFWLAGSCAMSCLAYLLICVVPNIPPLLFTVLLGGAYTCFAASIWASIPLLVPFELSGSAFGIAGSLQMLATGLGNLVVGRILETVEGDAKWNWMMYFLGATAGASLALAIVLLIVDSASGRRLAPTQMQLHAALVSGEAHRGLISSTGYAPINSDAYRPSRNGRYDRISNWINDDDDAVTAARYQVTERAPLLRESRQSPRVRTPGGHMRNNDGDSSMIA